MTAAPAITVAPIRDADLAAVAEVHARAFPDSAITAFGAEAVRRYYAWLKDGPHDAALVGAWQERRLVGFCAAGTFRGALTGYLKKNRRYLALRMALRPWLAVSPLVRDRVRQGVQLLVRARAPAPASVPVEPRFGVLSIATDPSARGSGAGRALMAEAEARARRLGFARMILTVHPGNARAIRFYEQLGWERGTGSEMFKCLDAAQGPASIA